MVDDNFDYTTPNYNEAYEEPETWTLISAFDRVLNEVSGSQLSKEFWEKCKNPIDYLTQALTMTRMQVVVLAILLEYDTPLTWRSIGKYVGVSRLSIMKYTNEIEELVSKRWLEHRRVSRPEDFGQGYRLAPGVISALNENRPFVPEKIDGLDLNNFIKRLVKYFDNNVCETGETTFDDDKKWVLMMCEANSHLALCREAINFRNDLDSLMFFMSVVNDYAQWGGMEYEGLDIDIADKLYPDNYDTECMKESLRDGTHRLFEADLIEHTCVDGLANPDSFRLTRRSKEELLKGFTPTGMNGKVTIEFQGMTHHTDIKKKTMFYNKAEQQQIERLTNLLSQENLPGIQQRLEDQGLRKGFACLFYGAPGTGKTETVLQIARRTGRDIMQVDIASMRDKYVGESEKNIKDVFERYRTACKQSEVMPILFFNEADAIFSKRTAKVEHSVDRMDNAMQNIILQEMENLEGILIATTNLTSNFDKAFERRFLFKVEFHIPEVSVKQQLWSCMLQGISEEDAHHLAVNYNFSGGQIENIARQRAIDFVLSGKESTLKDIEGYCKAEIMEKNKNKRPVIGFR
jgi:hypothetical protein